MTFSELIRTAEREYRDVMLSTMAEHRKAGLQIIPEPALRNAEGELVFGIDAIDLPMRYDFVTIGPDGEVEAHFIDPLIFDISKPLSARWLDNLEIETLSFSWDSLCIKGIADSTPRELGAIRKWFFDWFHPRDDVSCGQPELLGVVHFLKGPEYIDGAIQIYADLGSAHRDTLADLFDALTSMGVERCIITADEVYDEC